MSGHAATHAALRPVVLCGGSGTRLWPLSRKSFPKQFIPLVDGKSLLQLTIERLARLQVAPGGMLFVAAEEHRFIMADALQAAGIQADLLLEPVGRNTAAAIALACLHAPGDLLLFCPSDHHVPDAKAFADVVTAAIPAAQAGAIVTFGITPTHPSTAYGYIREGDPRPGGGRVVLQFVEKPSVEAATRLLLGGGVSWNAGIFLCKASTMLAALGEHAPDILASCRDAMAEVSRDGIFLRPRGAAFTACRAESIDYAVMQKHQDIAVFPFAGAWSDVGSWDAAASLVAPDEAGNRIVGQGIAVQAKGTYVHAPHRPVVALGTEDLLIVDTPDALLVASRRLAQDVRQVVAQMEASQTAQAVTHRKVYRPWGWYDGIDAGERFIVKHIFVKPGGSTSLQVHSHRAEHWIVVRGTAQVTRGDETFTLRENESTYIPLGHPHRLTNPGEVELELIEVQSGSLLSEDDIVRLDDQYGRILP